MKGVLYSRLCTKVWIIEGSHKVIELRKMRFFVVVKFGNIPQEIDLISQNSWYWTFVSEYI